VVSERKSSQPVRVANGRIQQKEEGHKGRGTRDKSRNGGETGNKDGNDKGVDVENIVQELKHSIERTQFDMQHHLQESQEHLSRGKNEMKTTLSNIHTSLEAGQDKIVQLLMQMVHGKKHLIMEGTMELVVLMEENGIKWNLIIELILKDKASLGAQLIGYQGIAGTHLGLICLVSWIHNNKMFRVIWR
jgi:hypothetical protein